MFTSRLLPWVAAGLLLLPDLGSCARTVDQRIREGELMREPSILEENLQITNKSDEDEWRKLVGNYHMKMLYGPAFHRDTYLMIESSLPRFEDDTCHPNVTLWTDLGLPSETTINLTLSGPLEYARLTSEALGPPFTSNNDDNGDNGDNGDNDKPLGGGPFVKNAEVILGSWSRARTWLYTARTIVRYRAVCTQRRSFDMLERYVQRDLLEKSPQDLASFWEDNVFYATELDLGGLVKVRKELNPGHDCSTTWTTNDFPWTMKCDGNDLKNLSRDFFKKVAAGRHDGFLTPVHLRLEPIWKLLEQKDPVKAKDMENYYRERWRNATVDRQQKESLWASRSTTTASPTTTSTTGGSTGPSPAGPASLMLLLLCALVTVTPTLVW